MQIIQKLNQKFIFELNEKRRLYLEKDIDALDVMENPENSEPNSVDIETLRNSDLLTLMKKIADLDLEILFLRSDLEQAGVATEELRPLSIIEEKVCDLPPLLLEIIKEIKDELGIKLEDIDDNEWDTLVGVFRIRMNDHQGGPNWVQEQMRILFSKHSAYFILFQQILQDAQKTYDLIKEKYKHLCK